MICCVCGSRFDADELGEVRDRYPYGEGEVEQTTQVVCPYCSSEEVDEECVCEDCREEFARAELCDGLCRMCCEELQQTLDWIRSMLSPAQLKWVSEHPDWVDGYTK